MLEDFVNIAGAHNNLELSGIQETAFKVFVIVNSTLINGILVLQDQAQTSCAVSRRADVVRAPDILQHALCH